MLAFRIAAAAMAFVAAASADPAPAPSATLEAIAVDGLRTCMSISEGRTPLEAASIFGFLPDPAAAGAFMHQTDKGQIDILPPAADRRSCRVSVSALTLDPKTVLDAVQAFVTTPPQSYAPLQSRIAESLGNGYASRTTIWAASDGKALNQVTLYEILAGEYYHGPKVLIDHLIDRR